MIPSTTPCPIPTPVSCINGGVANLAECVCPVGYTGVHCENESPEDACKNGSTAVGATCVCLPGFSGPRCEEYNSSRACQNGGTPVGTECVCPPGYNGAQCESSNKTTTAAPATTTTTTTTTTTQSTTTSTTTTTTTTVPTTTTTTTPSTAAVPCQNGGTRDGNTCICQDGYYGSQCENSRCDNGGTWVNGACQCTSDFLGSACQYAAEAIEVKAEVNVTVNVTLQVTSREFSPALRNETSTEYKEFALAFKLQMNLVYSNVPGYQDVKILKLTPGSVVVDHIVLLALPVNDELEQKVDTMAGELKTQIEKAAQNQTNCNSSGVCFNASSAAISRATQAPFNSTEHCQKNTPPGYSQFYFPFLTKFSFSCISNCTKATPGFMDCNNGQCQLTKAGPQCFCPEMDYWYYTERCATRVSKLGLGLGLAIAVLVLVSAVLGIFLFRAKRMKTQYSMHSLEEELEKKWYEEDDGEWSAAGSFTIRNEGADHGKDSAGSPSFQINLGSIDSSVPVHIQRPAIVASQL